MFAEETLHLRTSFFVLLFVGCCLFSEASGTSPCAVHTGSSCEECLTNVSCLWCSSNNTCVDYPVRTLIPSTSICPLSKARWGVCWVNFEALIIAMAVVGGIILLSVIVCCYCCCCRSSSSRYFLF
uniref:Pituitary tumor-transforming gene 1 protein-interacting protein-like n=1 Tax=Erpetoichthys calabaricus TaxID=27687 RepID=A0A8C4SVI7_ERPCA